MKLYEFIHILLEYKRDITKQKLGNKLVAAALRDRKQDIDMILTSLEEADPTKNKQYVEWLCRQYIAGTFRLEDKPRIRNVLTQFEKIKPQLTQRDINKYTFRSLEDKMDEIYDVKVDDTSTPGEKAVIPTVPGSEVLYNGSLGQLAIPKTKEASIELGKGTKWCTARNDWENAFTSYAEQSPVYVWIDVLGKKYQFFFGKERQFMDSRNKPLNRKTLDYFRKQNPVTSKLFKEQEKAIASNPTAAVSYAMYVIKGRWPEGEKAIVSDPDAACRYAMYVIKGRWPEAEKAIASNPTAAVSYAINVIKGRWPEAEKAIASDPKKAVYYAIDVIKGRWPEAEEAIASDPNVACRYAESVIKGRWPEAEKAIASDPDAAVYYAKDTIKGRWPEAEKAIASDPDAAVYYAIYVIKGRWPEAEEAIASDPDAARRYARGVINGRWPEQKKQ